MHTTIQDYHTISESSLNLLELTVQLDNQIISLRKCFLNYSMYESEVSLVGGFCLFSFYLCRLCMIGQLAKAVFSPSLMWVQETELKLPGLLVSTFLTMELSRGPANVYF